MKSKIIYIFIAVVILNITSCSDWLNVQPKTSVLAEDLFNEEAGFKDALTGCYLLMVDQRLYSGDLMYGYLDVLSGIYSNYPAYTSIDWEEEVWNHNDYFQPVKDGIYRKLYNVISNVNNLLYYLEENKSVIKTEGYYEIIKGEALGLRAYLHFDLLRMFGPACYKDNSEEKAISYRKTFDSQATKILTAQEVIENIIADLESANELLLLSDTKLFRTSETETGEEADPFLVERQMRMNIYAVKALLARVYCYCGDASSKTKACIFAKEVIGSEYFELYDSHQNNILYNEHIFSLSAYELYKTIESNYPTGLSVSNSVLNSQFYVTPDKFMIFYETEGAGSNDWRAAQSAFSVRNENGSDYKLCRKFEQNNLSEYNGKDVLPLIRLPEMYYIIAECDNRNNSIEALNIMRQKRGISYTEDIPVDANYDKLAEGNKYDPNITNRLYYIRDEIRKEYFSEGALFYFYKKYNFKTFEGCVYDDVRDKYKFSLPDDEISFGDNN
jgi:SusD family.